MQYARVQANRLFKHFLGHASCTIAAGGLSAGVALASPWQYGLQALQFDQSIAIPPPERFIASSLYGLVYRRIPLMSVYLYTGLGAAWKNQECLWQIAGYINALGCPFVLCGDWNMRPELLKATMAKWLLDINASIVAPDEFTYISGEHATTINYFVVHNDLIDGASVETFESDKIKKHIAVVLSLPGSARRRLVEIPVRMPAFPLEIPVKNAHWMCAGPPRDRHPR